MTFEKDPDAVLDYTLDWGPWLGTDTIASVVWLTRAPLEVDHQEHTPRAATVWLKGGAVRQAYTVVCRTAPQRAVWTTAASLSASPRNRRPCP